MSQDKATFVESKSEENLKYGSIRTEGVTRDDRTVAMSRFCQRWCETIFPAGILSPLQDIFRLAWAIMLTNITQMLMGPISLMMVGHLDDPVQFGAASLAMSVINVACVATAQGLGTGCDTFFSQSFGSPNKKMVGIYLQKAVYIFAMVEILFIVLYLNIGNLLVLAGQNPDVSRLAGRYLMIFLPGSVCYFMYIILMKYLQNQNIVIPNVIIGITANMLNALLHYIFLYKLNWGTDGSALSQTLAQFVMCSSTIIYIGWSKVYKETWEGWTTESLRDWGPFTRTCISGMLLVTSEWWTVGIGSFLAGLLGLTDLGAMSVVLGIDGIWFEIFFGLQTSIAIRIGQLVGERDETGARTVAHLALLLYVVLSLVPFLMYQLLSHQLGYIVTNIRDVVDLASSLFLIISTFQIFDSLVTAGKAILCGVGHQIYGVLVMLACHAFIALPIGIPLMFLTSLGVKGFWWAISGSQMVQAIVIVYLVSRINWSVEVEKGEERAGMKETPDTDDGDFGHGKAATENIIPFVLAERTTEKEGLIVESKKLTTSQLMLRRGSVLLLMVLILCVGIACSLFIPFQPSKHPQSDINVTTACPPGNTTLYES